MFQTPRNEDEWRQISTDYHKIWNFPLCLGAMDGKHILMEAPAVSGSEFYNYKGTFSIVLFAIVDPNYNFIYANAGCQGRISDGGVFKNTSFHKLMVDGRLSLPPKTILAGRERECSYVFVADDAFPLTPHIMKPYSGHQEKGSVKRIFNYRLSRARRVVENAFGILAARFRVLRKPILLQPKKTEQLVMACIHLHNYLRRSSPSRNRYTPPGSFDIEHLDSGTLENGEWRKATENQQSFRSLSRIARKPSLEAAAIRDEFAQYFASEQGQVPWQVNYC